MSRAVLFDLDGTLLDTISDVAAAANTALREGGYSERPVTDFRRLLGGGVVNLFRAALPPGSNSPSEIAHCIERFHAAYESCWNRDTQPYAGITELVHELSRRGLMQVVLSNKPHEFTRKCIDEYFGDPRTAETRRDAASGETIWESTSAIGPFAAVIGQRAGVPVKPDPTSALEIATALAIRPEDFIYLGDTSIDMETARHAGMRPIGVLWGFRDRDELVASGAEAVIESPLELLTLLE